MLEMGGERDRERDLCCLKALGLCGYTVGYMSVVVMRDLLMGLSKGDDIWYLRTANRQHHLQAS